MYVLSKLWWKHITWKSKNSNIDRLFFMFFLQSLEAIANMSGTRHLQGPRTYTGRPTESASEVGIEYQYIKPASFVR